MNRDDLNISVARSVVVSIFNQPYSLRSPQGGERIIEIARLVDERMQQISAQITTHDTTKIAVLAALNIADELQTIKERLQQQEDEAHAAESLSHERQTTDEKTVASPEPPPQKTESSAEPQSWFEAIFDADAPAPRGRERLSSKISAKLQSLREAEQPNITIEPEES